MKALQLHQKTMPLIEKSSDEERLLFYLNFARLTVGSDDVIDWIALTQ